MITVGTKFELFYASSEFHAEFSQDFDSCVFYSGEVLSVHRQIQPFSLLWKRNRTTDKERRWGDGKREGLAMAVE